MRKLILSLLLSMISTNVFADMYLNGEKLIGSIKSDLVTGNSCIY